MTLLEELEETARLWLMISPRPAPLDESAIIAAAGAVLGEHDFTSFAFQTRHGEIEPWCNTHTIQCAVPSIV